MAKLMPFIFCFIYTFDYSIFKKSKEETSNEQFYVYNVCCSHPMSFPPAYYWIHSAYPTFESSFLFYIFLILIKQILILTLMIAIMILHYVKC